MWPEPARLRGQDRAVKRLDWRNFLQPWPMEAQGRLRRRTRKKSRMLKLQKLLDDGFVASDSVRSFRASRRLHFLETFQQCLGIGILGRKLQGALQLRARKVQFLLLEIDARKRCTHHGRVPDLQRSLQLLGAVFQLAPPPKDFC